MKKIGNALPCRYDFYCIPSYIFQGLNRSLQKLLTMDLQFSIAKEIWAHNFLLSTSFLKRKWGYCEHLRLSVISCGFLFTIEDCTVSDVLLWQKLRLLRPTSILRRRTLSNQRGLRTFLQTFMGTPLWLYCLGEDPYRWQFNG